MKKYFLAILALLFFILLFFVGSTWMRIERLYTGAEQMFEVVSDFYVSMDSSHLISIDAPTDLDASSLAALQEFRSSIALLQEEQNLVDKIALLRGAQRAAFIVFANANGSILHNADYDVWRKELSLQGKAYPLLLQYNQAAQAFNDGLKGIISRSIARLRGLSILELINVDGHVYQQQPITI